MNYWYLKHLDTRMIPSGNCATIPKHPISLFSTQREREIFH